MVPKKLASSLGRLLLPNRENSTSALITSVAHSLKDVRPNIHLPFVPRSTSNLEATLYSSTSSPALVSSTRVPCILSNTNATCARVLGRLASLTPTNNCTIIRPPNQVLSRFVHTEIKEFPTVSQPPISAEEFDRFMEQTTISKDALHGIAVATSGGADSMALVLLMDQWIKRNNIECKLLAITVDHNLRPESTDEAKHVGKWLKQRGITQIVAKIEWGQERPKETSLQAVCREKRYQILEHICTTQGIHYLFTAHHKDDQLETFLYRTALLSGIGGMAGIPILMTNSNSGLRIVRPLLSVSKERLRATCVHLNQKWVEDPSNNKQIQVRSVVRGTLKQWQQQHGFQIERLFGIVDHMTQLRQILLEQTVDFVRRYVYVSQQFGYCCVNIKNLRMLKDEVASRVLTNLFVHISGSRSYTSLEAQQRLLRDLLAGDHTFKKQSHFTLAGCLLVLVRNTLFIVREHLKPPRSPIDDVRLEQPVWWDNRFVFTCGLREDDPDENFDDEDEDGSDDYDDDRATRRSITTDDDDDNDNDNDQPIQARRQRQRQRRRSRTKKAVDPDTMVIRRLNELDWNVLVNDHPHLKALGLPYFIRLTLPLIEDSRGIVAVPHLGVKRDPRFHWQIRFKPQFPVVSDSTMYFATQPQPQQQQEEKQ